MLKKLFLITFIVLVSQVIFAKSVNLIFNNTFATHTTDIASVVESVNTLSLKVDSLNTFDWLTFWLVVSTISSVVLSFWFSSRQLKFSQKVFLSSSDPFFSIIFCQFRFEYVIKQTENLLIPQNLNKKENVPITLSNGSENVVVNPKIEILIPERNCVRLNGIGEIKEYVPINKYIIRTSSFSQTTHDELFYKVFNDANYCFANTINNLLSDDVKELDINRIQKAFSSLLEDDLYNLAFNFEYSNKNNQEYKIFGKLVPNTIKGDINSYKELGDVCVITFRLITKIELIERDGVKIFSTKKKEKMSFISRIFELIKKATHTSPSSKR